MDDDDKLSLSMKTVAATVAVLIAAVLSYIQKLGMEKEMVYASVRAIIQLSIVGFVLEFIFTRRNVLWILLAYLFMVTYYFKVLLINTWSLIWIFTWVADCFSRSHSRQKSKTYPEWKLYSRNIDSHRNKYHTLCACHAWCLPFHFKVHHPHCRYDGRQRHDSHRSHNEKTPWRSQTTKGPGIVWYSN